MNAAAASVLNNSIVETILHRGMSHDELRCLVSLAERHSGELVAIVAWDGGRELCPRFRFPWPLPRTFGGMVEEVMKLRRPLRMFSHGIMAPQEILVEIGAPSRAF